jgi:hypothetical protein
MGYASLDHHVACRHNDHRARRVRLDLLQPNLLWTSFSIDRRTHTDTRSPDHIRFESTRIRNWRDPNGADRDSRHNHHERTIAANRILQRLLGDRARLARYRTHDQSHHRWQDRARKRYYHGSEHNRTLRLCRRGLRAGRRSHHTFFVHNRGRSELVTCHILIRVKPQGSWTRISKDTVRLGQPMKRVIIAAVATLVIATLLVIWLAIEAQNIRNV